MPQLLDIIEILFSNPAPRGHQTENHVIEPGLWRKNGTLEFTMFEQLLDAPPSLWGSGEHTYGGVNDCVSRELAARYDHSLMLIRPPDLRIRIKSEGHIYQKRVVRALFRHAGVYYALNVTDPIADAAFQQKSDGEYPLDAYLCVSLAEPYEKDNRCHKLAAAVISSEPF